jgi:hypothetical protein
MNVYLRVECLIGKGGKQEGIGSGKIQTGGIGGWVRTPQMERWG